jgi:hypothetical protein
VAGPDYRNRPEPLKILAEKEQRRQHKQVTSVTLDILFRLVVCLLLSVLYRFFRGGSWEIGRRAKKKDLFEQHDGTLFSCILKKVPAI